MPDTDRPAATDRDETRQRYTLSLDVVMARFDEAQMPRTMRTLQRYCASGRLDCLKIETPTGDAYVVDPTSVERAIGELKMIYADRPSATDRDTPHSVAHADEPHARSDTQRPVATDRDSEIVTSDISQQTAHDTTRPSATERDVSPTPLQATAPATEPDTTRQSATSTDIFEHPYVKRLEHQIERLEERYEAQVRRTEDIQLRAQDKLVELQRMTTIGQSKTLADFMLQAKNWIVGGDEDPAAKRNGEIT